MEMDLELMDTTIMTLDRSYDFEGGPPRVVVSEELNSGFKLPLQVLTGCARKNL